MQNEHAVYVFLCHFKNIFNARITNNTWREFSQLFKDISTVKTLCKSSVISCKIKYYTCFLFKYYAKICDKIILNVKIRILLFSFVYWKIMFVNVRMLSNSSSYEDFIKNFHSSFLYDLCIICPQQNYFENFFVSQNPLKHACTTALLDCLIIAKTTG